jgi:hypothetical protein
MAIESISPAQRAECIRMQAERVCRAYKALREAPKSAEFQSDDFPVGHFATLVTEIRRLDGWLEPTDETSADEHLDVMAAAGEPFGEVSLCLEQSQALADVLQLSTENNELADGTITVVAGMLFNRMHDARKHLDALWVAIGGKQ